jgi:hypothetical protein
MRQFVSHPLICSPSAYPSPFSHDMKKWGLVGGLSIREIIAFAYKIAPHSATPIFSSLFWPAHVPLACTRNAWREVLFSVVCLHSHLKALE